MALWAIETIGITGGFYVAIDASPRQSPQAYIFDAGWMEADFGLRDLATLEVTTILFNSAQMNEDFVYVTTLLYDSGFMFQARCEQTLRSPISRETRMR